MGAWLRVGAWVGLCCLAAVIGCEGTQPEPAAGRGDRSAAFVSDGGAPPAREERKALPTCPGCQLDSPISVGPMVPPVDWSQFTCGYGYCGGRALAGCWCDGACAYYGDCCDDYVGSCVAECNGSVSASAADERVHAMALGPNGEIYLAGTRALQNQFASDGVDGFLRRVHPQTYATLWDVSVDNCFWDTVEDVTVSAAGDVYVVGSTRSGPFATTETDFFVRRYTSGGAMRWQASPNTTAGETGLGIATDESDNSVVVTGAVTPPGQPFRLLFARIASSGAVVRNTSLSPRPSAVGRAIAVDSAGRIAVVGDALDQPGTSLRYAMVARLDASGSVLWSSLEGAASATSHTGIDVAMDNSGRIFALTESFWYSSSSQRLPSLVSYNLSGGRLWARQINLGGGFNPAGGLVRDPYGALVVAGHASQKPWLARYNVLGGFLFARQLSGPTVSLVADVAVVGATALIAAQVPGPTGRATQVVAEPL